jgi:hypothetical protein
MPAYFKSRASHQIVREQVSAHVRANKIELIREYSKNGYSANQQQYLWSHGQGMRRQEVLKYVRYFKETPHKTDSSKYIPKKFRKK